MKYCPSCNGAFEPEHAYCPKDGTRLVRNSRNHTPSLVGKGPTRELRPQRTPTPTTDGEPTQVIETPASDENSEEAEIDEVIGTVIAGRYYIERRLGEGGMGVVYAGVDQRLEKPVAVKLLRDDFARRGDVVARFTQEAKSAARIKHENVLDVTDYGQTEDGSFYITMELLVGNDLADALQQDGTIEPTRGVDIAIQICRALGSAHQKGVIHRDMKPENVFLVRQDDGREIVKIVDFGIAQMKDISGASPEGARKLTRTGMIFGTPEYMSPEQSAGKPIDHRVDVYATGVILYEMFAGRVPFLGDTFMGVLTQHMFDAPQPIRSIHPAAVLSEDLEGVIFKALAKSPADRYASMQDLADDLTRVRAGARPTAPGLDVPMVLPDRASMSALRAQSGGHNARSDVVPVSHTVENELTRPPSRRRAVLVGGGVIVLAAVIVGAVALTSGSSGSTSPATTVATHTPQPSVTTSPPPTPTPTPTPTPMAVVQPTLLAPPTPAVQVPSVPAAIHLHVTTGSVVASVRGESADAGVAFECAQTPCDETVLPGTSLHLVATAAHGHGALDVTALTDGQSVEVPLRSIPRPNNASTHETHGSQSAGSHSHGGTPTPGGRRCGYLDPQTQLLVPCFP